MNLKEINKLTIGTYKKVANKYHENFKDEMLHKDFDRAILDEFSKHITKPGLICDAGCGPSGHIGKYLQQNGYNIIGIDISPDCIDIARGYENDIQFIEMDMMNTSFELDKFDGIISFYSIIHTPKKDVSKIIKEFNRILKPNGRVLIVIKKGDEEGIVSDDWYDGNEIYFSTFTENELKSYFVMNGFEIEHVETRAPYDSEIDVERIYLIAKKVKSPG